MIRRIDEQAGLVRDETVRPEREMSERRDPDDVPEEAPDATPEERLAEGSLDELAPAPDDEADAVAERPTAQGAAETDGDEIDDAEQQASVEADLGPASDDELALDLPENQLFRDPEGEDRDRLLRVLEALLFASPEPLSTARLSEIVGLATGLVKDALEELQQRLDAEERPYELVAYGPGWRLFTRRDFYPFLLRLRSIKKVEKLTPAALETLAIVAYRQPVIRADIEAIRGVKVGPMLRALMDRKLVRVLGRAEVPGAPLQYGTTARFLDRFGLSSLEDLPSLKEFKQGRI